MTAITVVNYGPSTGFNAIFEAVIYYVIVIVIFLSLVTRLTRDSDAEIPAYDIGAATLPIFRAIIPPAVRNSFLRCSFQTSAFMYH